VKPVPLGQWLGPGGGTGRDSCGHPDGGGGLHRRRHRGPERVHWPDGHGSPAP